MLAKLSTKDAEVQDIDGNWYAMRILPYRTMENVIDGVVITFVDVTKLKEAKEILRESETDRLLAAVFRDSNDAITVQDFKGNITHWNKAAHKMYGYSKNEALKLNVRDIVPEDKQEEALAFIMTLQEEEVESFETQRITKDGRRLDVWLAVTRLIDEDGKPIAVATTERDITGRK